MLIELIVLIIFVCSLGGVLLILVRKVSVINSLPQNGSTGIREHRIISEIESKLKNAINFFEKQIFLHKFLSFIKVMVLKIETRIDHLLHKIRQKNKPK